MSERFLDLDAARAERDAARRAAGWQPPTLMFGGKTFVLPDEIPAQYAWSVVEGDAREALQVLLGADFDPFWELGPTLDDVKNIVAKVAVLYSPEEQNGSSTRPKSGAQVDPSDGKG